VLLGSCFLESGLFVYRFFFMDIKEFLVRPAEEVTAARASAIYRTGFYELAEDLMDDWNYSGRICARSKRNPSELYLKGKYESDISGSPFYLQEDNLGGKERCEVTGYAGRFMGMDWVKTSRCSGGNKNMLSLFKDAQALKVTDGGEESYRFSSGDDRESFAERLYGLVQKQPLFLEPLDR
jgi:hypothetical protein